MGTSRKTRCCAVRRYQPEESEYVVEEVEVTETVDVKEEPAKL